MKIDVGIDLGQVIIAIFTFEQQPFEVCHLVRFTPPHATVIAAKEKKLMKIFRKLFDVLLPMDYLL